MTLMALWWFQCWWKLVQSMRCFQPINAHAESFFIHPVGGAKVRNSMHWMGLSTKNVMYYSKNKLYTGKCEWSEHMSHVKHLESLCHALALCLSLTLSSYLYTNPRVRLCTDNCIKYAEIISISRHIPCINTICVMYVCVCLTCCCPPGYENGSSRKMWEYGLWRRRGAQSSVTMGTGKY